MADEFCRQHFPNDEIDGHAKTISEDLRQGAPRFLDEYNQYMTQLRARPDANAALSEFFTDMYCRDPGDVTIHQSNGIADNMTIDAWRVFEKNSLMHLRAGDSTAQDIQNYANKNIVDPESRDLFVRQFNQDVKDLQMHYQAQKNANGEIQVQNVP